MSSVHSPGQPPSPNLSAADRTLKALDFVHGLLTGPGLPASELRPVLRELARVFEANAAGSAVTGEGTFRQAERVAENGSPAREERWPWEDHPDLLHSAAAAEGARVLPTADGTGLLITGVRQPDGRNRLVWLEAGGDRVWSSGEKAALTLAGELLVHRLASTGEQSRWFRTLAQQRQHRRLEEAATLTGRLAHDFGNVLTGVLGFADLALGLLSPSSAPYRHVREMYLAAQRGAQMIQKLALLSRRRPNVPRLAALPAVLADQASRARASWGPDVTVHLEVSDHLPLAGLDAESLGQVLEQLLDNAREAITGPGAVTLSARRLTLDDSTCLDFVGRPVPGEHLEIAVADTGVGLAPEVRGRLLNEVFFTSKPGHRGLGLAVVFGLLQACRGGFQLAPGAAGGTVARVVVPRGEGPAGSAGALAAAGPRREKVLVVDDDPLTLQMVCTVLARAGYRVQPAGGGAQALDAYRAAVPEPFGLVLSDVVMPAMNGFDLARRLLGVDPAVKILFLTGQGPSPPADQDPALCRFALLSKPFRPEGLLQAVRSTLSHEG
jgi:signal transduction histidine kinase/ActR/RegA family two-component response regulator